MYFPSGEYWGWKQGASFEWVSCFSSQLVAYVNALSLGLVSVEQKIFTQNARTAYPIENIPNAISLGGIDNGTSVRAEIYLPLLGGRVRYTTGG